jgi:hypothetical protein
LLATEKNEGLQLLRNKLLRTLDCMPLATTRATAYFNQYTRITGASYLDEFRRNSKKRESLANWYKEAEKLNRQALEEREI